MRCKVNSFFSVVASFELFFNLCRVNRRFKVGVLVYYMCKFDFRAGSGFKTVIDEWENCFARLLGF